MISQRKMAISRREGCGKVDLGLCFMLSNVAKRKTRAQPFLTSTPQSGAKLQKWHSFGGIPQFSWKWSSHYISFYHFSASSFIYRQHFSSYPYFRPRAPSPRPCCSFTINVRFSDFHRGIQFLDQYDKSSWSSNRIWWIICRRNLKISLIWIPYGMFRNFGNIFENKSCSEFDSLQLWFFEVFHSGIQFPDSC